MQAGRIATIAALVLSTGLGPTNSNVKQQMSNESQKPSLEEIIVDLKSPTPNILFENKLPLPEGMEYAANFFKYAYTETDNAIIYDRISLQILDEIPIGNPLKGPTVAEREQVRKAKIRAKAKTKGIVESLTGKKTLLTKNLEGLVPWLPHVYAEYESHGLARNIIALNVVETSLDPNAISKDKAAGLGQFMLGTGRQFMMINQSVDERLDPVYSARATSRYLLANYARHGMESVAPGIYHAGKHNWDLAMTYALAKISGRTEEEILDHILNFFPHEPRSTRNSFKFASRNYVPSIAGVITGTQNNFSLQNSEFPPILFDTVEIQYTGNSKLTANDIINKTGISMDQLRILNPGLLYPRRNDYSVKILHGQRISSTIPEKYGLRLPVGTGETLRETVPSSVATINLLPREDFTNDIKLNRWTEADQAYQEVANTRRNYGVYSVTAEELGIVRNMYALELNQIDSNNITEQKWVLGRIAAIDFDIKGLSEEMRTSKGQSYHGNLIAFQRRMEDKYRPVVNTGYY